MSTDTTPKNTAKATAPKPRTPKKAAAANTTATVTLDVAETKKPTSNYHVVGLPGVDGRDLPAYFRKEDVQKATDPKTGTATFVIRFKPTA